MKKTLAVKLNPKHFAIRHGHLDDTSALSEFPRLADLLANDEGVVNWVLDGYLDEKKRIVLTGSIVGQLPLRCQRCLNSYNHEIKFSFRVSPISEEKMATQLPEGYEPLLLEEEELSIADLLSDEIILALPLIGRHNPEQCIEKSQVWEYGIEETKNDKGSGKGILDAKALEKEDTYKPFADLRKRIKSGGKKK